VSEERPAWRQGFDAVEGVVGPRLTALVNSEAFAIAVGIATRAEHTMRQRSERTTRQLLHRLNLPAGSDVTRLLAEIGTLQQQVRELTKQLNAKGEAPNGAKRGPNRPARSRPT
jgi:predicted transcriptional regulator